MKYGLDCWMIEEEGKCRAEAEARGLPEEKGEKGGQEIGMGKERRKRNVRRRTKLEKNTVRLTSFYCIST